MVFPSVSHQIGRAGGGGLNGLNGFFGAGLERAESGSNQSPLILQENREGFSIFSVYGVRKGCGGLRIRKAFHRPGGTCSKPAAKV